MEFDKKIRVRIETTEELLGTASNNPNIHDEFIASKAPDAKSREEEIEALGADAVAEKGMTVFPRGMHGEPIVWDYQIKGFLKDACSSLRGVTGSECSKVKSYKKVIDGRVFVREREIPIRYEGEMGVCQRPLRAQTMQGERVALAASESIPQGATLEFTILLLNKADEAFVRECLDYGQLRGLGQWRNSGKGRFYWEELPLTADR
jgi:hypothetical protein